MAIECFVGTFRSLTTDAASTTYTLTPNFTTKAGIVFTVGRGESTDASGGGTHRTSIGFFTTATNRGAMGCMSVDAAAAGSGNEWLRMDAVGATYTADTTTLDGQLDVSSISSTQCVFIVDDVFPVDMTFGALLFGGDSITNATVVEWDRATGTGTQDITTVGFQGNVLFTVGTNELGPAPVADAAGGQLFLGAATSSSDEHVAWFGMDQGSAAADTGAYANATECMYDVGGAINAPSSGQNTTTFSSWLSNGFQINKVATGRAGVNYISLVIAGGSWTVGDFTTRTTTGTIVESGFTYQPTGVLVLSVMEAAHTTPTNTDDAQFSIGASDGTNTVAMALVDDDGPADMEVATALDFDKIYLNLSVSDTVDGNIDFTSFNSDGFTLTQNDVDPSAFFAWYVAAGAVSTGTTGSGSMAVAIPTMAGTGKQQHTGTGSLAVAPSMTGTGKQQHTGSGTMAVPSPTFAGTGSVVDIIGTGTMAVAVPSMAGTGKQSHTGTGSLAVAPTMTGTAQQQHSGSGSMAVPIPSLAGTGKQQHTGTGSLAVPIPSMSGSAGFVGSGSMAVPVPTMSGTAQQSHTGTGDLAVSLTMAGTGTVTGAAEPEVGAIQTGGGSPTIRRGRRHTMGTWAEGREAVEEIVEAHSDEAPIPAPAIGQPRTLEPVEADVLPPAAQPVPAPVVAPEQVAAFLDVPSIEGEDDDEEAFLTMLSYL